MNNTRLTAAEKRELNERQRDVESRKIQEQVEKRRMEAEREEKNKQLASFKIDASCFPEMATHAGGGVTTAHPVGQFAGLAKNWRDASEEAELKKAKARKARAKNEYVPPVHSMFRASRYEEEELPVEETPTPSTAEDDDGWVTISTKSDRELKRKIRQERLAAIPIELRLPDPESSEEEKDSVWMEETHKKYAEEY